MVKRINELETLKKIYICKSFYNFYILFLNICYSRLKRDVNRQCARIVSSNKASQMQNLPSIPGYKFGDIGVGLMLYYYLYFYI